MTQVSKLVAIVPFAVVYGVANALANRLSVWHLGFWDPKFKDQAGNIAVADQALPVFIGFATLSFIIGIRSADRALSSADRARAAIGGAISGVVSGGLLLTEPTLSRLGVPDGLGFGMGLIMFWMAPAVTAIVVFRLLVNRQHPQGG